MDSNDNDPEPVSYSYLQRDGCDAVRRADPSAAAAESAVLTTELVGPPREAAVVDERALVTVGGQTDAAGSLEFDVVGARSRRRAVVDDAALEVAGDVHLPSNSHSSDNNNNKKHLKNVGPIRHCEPPHAHSPDVATVASHAACASMSTTTTTTTTTRDGGDRYGPIEWAQ